MSWRIRIWLVLIASSNALGCSSIPADRNSSFNQYMRFLGAGWSDGYHECDQSLRFHGQPGCGECQGGLYQVNCFTPSNTLANTGGESTPGPMPLPPSPMAQPVPAAPYAVPEIPGFATPSPSAKPSVPAASKPESVLAKPEYPKSPSDRLPPQRSESFEKSESLLQKSEQELPAPKSSDADDDFLLPSVTPQTSTPPSSNEIPLDVPSKSDAPSDSKLPYDPDDLLLPMKTQYQPGPQFQPSGLLPWQAQQQFAQQQYAQQQFAQQQLAQQQFAQQQMAQQQYAQQQPFAQQTYTQQQMAQQQYEQQQFAQQQYAQQQVAQRQLAQQQFAQQQQQQQQLAQRQFAQRSFAPQQMAPTLPFGPNNYPQRQLPTPSPVPSRQLAVAPNYPNQPAMVMPGNVATGPARTAMMPYWQPNAPVR